MVVMEFLVNLLLALRDANRNLNLECFREDLMSMQVHSCTDLTCEGNLSRIDRELKTAECLLKEGN